MLAGPISVSD